MGSTAGVHLKTGRVIQMSAEFGHSRQRRCAPLSPAAVCDAHRIAAAQLGSMLSHAPAPAAPGRGRAAQCRQPPDLLPLWRSLLRQLPQLLSCQQFHPAPLWQLLAHCCCQQMLRLHLQLPLHSAAAASLRACWAVAAPPVRRPTQWRLAAAGGFRREPPLHEAGRCMCVTLVCEGRQEVQQLLLIQCCRSASAAVPGG